MLACASHDHANVYSLGGKRGGSLEDPEFLYTIQEEGVCNIPDPNGYRPATSVQRELALRGVHVGRQGHHPRLGARRRIAA